MFREDFCVCETLNCSVYVFIVSLCHRNMPHTPHNRSTRSNSNNNTAITLTDIKTLIEGSDILNALKEGIEDVKKTLTALTKRVDLIDNRTTALEQKLRDLQHQQENIFSEIEERDRRKTNIVISGIAEKVDGTLEDRREWDKSEAESVFRDLGQFVEGSISNVFRIGKLSSTKPRLMRIVCSDVKIKRDVLRQAKNLRSMPRHKTVYVNPDMTPMEQSENKRLRDEFQRRRNLGEDIIIRRGKIIPKENFH